MVFSDEILCNLDDPDGCHYYWHDLGSERKVLSRCQTKGGSVVVWAAFSYSGLPNRAFTTKNVGFNAYGGVLGDHSLYFAAVNH